MKKRRFSDRQLYILRNHMPIGAVIEKILCIPTKLSEGAFRFRCPLCSRFNTAINPVTNLARCFHCQTSFNPIDMVMAVQNIGFGEAVTLLEKCMDTLADDKNMNHPAHSLPSRASNKPVALASILSTFMQQEQPDPDRPDKIDSSSPQPTASSDHITKLQQDMHRISEQIDQLKKIFNSLN